MQAVNIKEMHFSIETKFTHIPDPEPYTGAIDNMDRITILQELGVPSSVLATASYAYCAGSAFEMSSFLNSFLDSVLDYYTGLTFDEFPDPYSDEWRELRTETVVKAYQDEVYGF